VLCFWLCAVGANAQPTAADPQPGTCNAAEFGAEVINGPAHGNLCPKPRDRVLEHLSIRIAQTPSPNAEVFFEVLRSLRDHLQAAPTDSSWRVALARHIDEAFSLAKDSRLPSTHFALVRNGLPGVDPEDCLFITGDVGLAGYACYVLQGSARPAHPQGEQMVIHELADFSDAYLAHRALDIARRASLKLDVPALEAALKRLALANRRWSNLRKRGYLQYPWELAFSSVFSAYSNYQACFASDAFCTGEEGLDPERVRLIALHPGVGMGFSGFGWKQNPSADAALALSLEVLGINYYQADFGSYLGASVGAVVNDGHFGDVRPGVFVHVTRWVHLGYLLSVFQRETRYDGTVFLSTDLGSALGLDFLD
jgi:hypothetical protein